MAKSVLELAVGTGQWDAGLKKAKSALDNFTQANGGLRQALENESQKMQKFVQMIGSMESTAKTAKGQMNDYKSIIEQLTMQYNRMTEAQKKVIGQDYLQAIEQMKQKYQSVNEEIQEMNRSLNNVKLPDMKDGSGGLFSGLGDKMSGALQVFAGNLMTKASEAVVRLGSEMYGMVQQGIEMARAGEGVRIAFERLGRGDLLDGLREATHGTVTDLELMKAAVKFNDFKLPLDQLGTMLAFAQQKAKDTGQDVNYLVDSIVTGLGRKSLMILDNLGLSATEIKEKMKETGDMTKAVGAIIREQMAKAGDYVETAADRAAQANVSLQNKMEELGRKFAPVEEASNQLWTSMKIGILDIIGGPLARLLNDLTEAGRMRNALNDMGGNEQVDKQLGKLRVAKAAGSGYMVRSLYSEQVEQYNRQINTASQQLKDIRAWQSGERGEALQGRIGAIRDKYGSLDATKVKAEIDATKYTLAQYRQGAQQIMNASNASTGGTGGKGGKDTKTEQTELQKNQAKINELTQEYVKLGDKSTEAARERQAEIQKEIELLKERNGLLERRAEQAQGRLMAYAGDFDKPTKNVSGFGLLDSANDFGKKLEMPKDGLKLDDKAMKAVTKDIYKNLQKEQNKNQTKEQAIEGMSDLIGGVNNVFGGLQQMGIEIPQEIRSVTGVLNGILTVVMGIESIITVGQFLGIFHNGGIVPGFANGGTISHAANGYFVGGTHYSGDVTPIMANAGELVLNKAQQGNLASQLQGSGLSALNLTATIKGEQIRLALNNNGRRTGRGEYVQSRNVR